MVRYAFFCRTDAKEGFLLFLLDEFLPCPVFFVNSTVFFFSKISSRMFVYSSFIYNCACTMGFSSKILTFFLV